MTSGRGLARSALAKPVRRSVPPPPTSGIPSARHSGLPVGIAQFAGAAGAGMQLQNDAMLLWFVWFVALGIAMVARRRQPAVVPGPALHPSTV
jgi:hypothetical protein